ncbi:plant natriuretic peptide A [Hibiscus trionum]|uniref:Plant natriuretic peptide A n=1 Tax=Hibiscus trionum TaxID=183268 RepID=A0A9W7J7D3_HIBTR|nr:plant natriuretic peptide A [Hibiscus trionum]
MALLVLAMVTAAAVISKEACSVHGDIGTASFYNPPYIPTKCDGNREEQFPPGNLFVAVSEGLWDNGAACGRRYRLRCLSGPKRPCKHRTIDVKVVDFCPASPCPSTILLSRDAHRHGRKINIEYIQ